MKRRRAGIVVSALAVLLLLPSAVLATHLRPVGATPKLDPLVISYQQCAGSPNANHTPSASFGQTSSCSAPVPTTPWTTVGTPDNNGSPAQFAGSVRLDVCIPPGCTPADVLVSIKIDGLHCTAALLSATPAVCPGPTGAFHPYTGSVRATLAMRITDHCNKTSGGPPCPAQPGLAATASDTQLPIIIPCANVGGTGRCNSATSLNAVAPGYIVGGYRMNIASTVTVSDGGSDGNASTPGTSLFATEGIFVP